MYVEKDIRNAFSQDCLHVKFGVICVYIHMDYSDNLTQRVHNYDPQDMVFFLWVESEAFRPVSNS